MNKKVKEQKNMKKIILALLSIMVSLFTAGCGNNSNMTSTTTDTQIHSEHQKAADGESEVLITYFTVPEADGTDTSAGASRVADNGEVYGNTQYIAQLIQKAAGGDLFEIKTVQDYPDTHKPLLDFAYNELRDDARPELESKIENLDDYDVIFVGYPNWNADLPMPLYSLFEEYDFSGKTIIPFVTHGGSGFSSTVKKIAELEPNADVFSDGLSVSRNNVAKAKDEVNIWVKSLGF